MLKHFQTPHSSKLKNINSLPLISAPVTSSTRSSMPASSATCASSATRASSTRRTSRLTSTVATASSSATSATSAPRAFFGSTTSRGMPRRARAGHRQPIRRSPRSSGRLPSPCPSSPTSCSASATDRRRPRWLQQPPLPWAREISKPVFKL